MESDLNLEGISVIKPHNPLHDKLMRQRGLSRLGVTSNTQFYNNVVNVLNQCDEGDIIMVPLPKGVQKHNLRRVLSNRGLGTKDVKCNSQMRDAEGNPIPAELRPMRIQKLSSAKGTVIDTGEE